jgi:hypothetical protein
VTPGPILHLISLSGLLCNNVRVGIFGITRPDTTVDLRAFLVWSSTVIVGR